MFFGDPVLRQKAVAVQKIDAEIRRMATGMLETMYRSNGLGLAAEQIGRREAVCVVDVSPQETKEEGESSACTHVPMPLIMVNPEIREMKGEQTGQEGCLSFPEIFVLVKRAEEVDVSYTNLESRTETVHAGGLLARAIQHEIDHLKGILLVDHMSPVQKVAVAGKLKRLKRIAGNRNADR